MRYQVTRTLTYTYATKDRMDSDRLLWHIPAEGIVKHGTLEIRAEIGEVMCIELDRITDHAYTPEPGTLMCAVCGLYGASHDYGQGKVVPDEVASGDAD